MGRSSPPRAPSWSPTRQPKVGPNELRLDSEQETPPYYLPQIKNNFLQGQAGDLGGLHFLKDPQLPPSAWFKWESGGAQKSPRPRPSKCTHAGGPTQGQPAG